MQEYGLKEPEFIDMEIALRINLYRKTVEDDNIVQYNAEEIPDFVNEVPDSTEKVPDSTKEVPDSTEKVPDSVGERRGDMKQLLKQQILICNMLTEKESITSADVEKLLGVKQRRARTILKEMVSNGAIIKTGAARSTKYKLP